MRDMNVLRLRGNTMPPLTESVIQLTQTFQGNLSINTGGSQTDIRMFDLAAFVPGGASYWLRMRPEKVLLWLKPVGRDGVLEQDTLQVQIPGTDDGAPPMTFRDNSIDGMTLPHVGFKFGLRQRMRWINPSSPDTLFTVSVPGSTGGYKLFCVVTLGLVSPQLTT